MVFTPISFGIVDRCFLADVLDRHPVDFHLFRKSAHSTVFRQGRGRAAWLLEHRIFNGKRAKGARHAVDNPGFVSDDLNHASCALGNAGSFACRLHKVRARAAFPIAPFISAMRS